MKGRVRDPEGNEWDVLTYYDEEVGEEGGMPLVKHYAVIRLSQFRKVKERPIKVIETFHFGSFEDMEDWSTMDLIYVVRPTSGTNGIGYYDKDRADEWCQILNEYIQDVLNHRDYGEANGLAGSEFSVEVVEEWTG
jgi:hypothetical protein